MGRFEALVGHLWMAIFIGVLAIWFWQIVGTSPGNPADVRLVKHAELREVILQARKLAVREIEKQQRAVPTSELLAA